MAIAEATVEVLTAEVRVLMVGSRQVTLSVARQLDNVEPDEIVPFGRIVTGRKPDQREEFIEVIGSREGVLVRASVTSESMICCSTCQGGRRVCGYESHMPCDKREPHENHRWMWYYPDRQMWGEWGQLPLIVLAGLR